MTPLDLDALERLAAEAQVTAPLPWRVFEGTVIDGDDVQVAECSVAEADYIAAAANAVPALVARVRELESERDEALDLLRRCEPMLQRMHDELFMPDDVEAAAQALRHPAEDLAYEAREMFRRIAARAALASTETETTGERRTT